MVEYIIDFSIVALLIIVITALMGVIGQTVGTKIFGGKNKNIFVDKSKSMQTGWKDVGGGY